MGWQDAPLVETASGKWADAPLVEGKGINPLLNYNPGVGLLETGAALASGTAGTIAGGISGLGTIATNALGLTNTPPGDRVRQVSEALTYQPRTAAGQGLTQGAALPFELLAKGGDFAGGAVTDASKSPFLGAVANTGIQSIPMLFGPLARALPGESAASISARQAAQARNAPQDAAIAAARERGLKLTPQEAEAGPVARGTVSIAGEPRQAKLNSAKNSPTINDMVRRDIGLAEDVPLKVEELKKIRLEEGANYEAVKNAGQIELDTKYRSDLKAISDNFSSDEGLSHRAESPIFKTLDGLQEIKSAATAVKEVKLLRNDAEKAFRNGDKELGKAYRAAAQAVDDQLDRALKGKAAAGGDPALAEAVGKYQAARQRIAKTYAAEEALNETTGNIDAKAYADMRRKGVPLTGEAAKVADFAQAFPRSTQRASAQATGPTIFDAALGLVFGEPIAGQSQGMRALAGLTARPLARSVMASDPIQSLLTSPRTYGPSGARTLQEIIRQVGDEAALIGVSSGQ